MRAAEVGDLGGFPAGEAVAALHGLDDPHIDGKRFESTSAEEEDAIGDFFADTGERAETLLCAGVGERFGFIEPAGMRGEELRGLSNVARAEAEEAGTEGGFGDGGELGPGGQAVNSVQNFCAVALCEEGHHLFDLDDLLRGAAEEAEQGFAEGLAQDAQAGKRGEAGGKVRIAAPRERVGEGGEIAVEAKVGAQGWAGGVFECGGCGPLERRGRLRAGGPRSHLADADEVVRPMAEKSGVGLAVPTEGLAAVESFGEDVGGERREVGEGLPGGPGRLRGHADQR